jgi:hypothetical protein
MTSPANPGLAAPGAQRPLESLPSPLDAVDDLRATAKWTLAAAGAVGAALISGGPLVAIGNVHGRSDALLAGLGLLCALAGVALSIWSTSRVLAPRLTTTETLKTSPKLARLRKQLGLDANGIEAILAQPGKERAIAASLIKQASAAKNQRRRPAFEYQLRRVNDNAARAESNANQFLALAHVWQIEADLRLSRRCTLGGGLLVVIGAVLFFLATGSGPTYVPVLTPQVTSSPAATTNPAPTATHSPSAALLANGAST